MKTQRWPILVVLILSLFGFGVVAQDAAETTENMESAIQVAELEGVGQYLTDAEGLSLYTFVAEGADMAAEPESMTEGVRSAAASCTEDCLAEWPVFTADGENMAGEGVDASLIHRVVSVDGREQVAYNGWPLYYFATDEEGSQIEGHGVESFGGTWYLISPDGQIIESEGMGTEGGETDDSEDEDGETDDGEDGEPDDGEDEGDAAG